MSKIFVLGGLGLDNAIISDISLRGKELTFIDWERPALSDTLSSYTSKLISKYRIDDNSIIIGVSFGGLIALEMSKTILLKKIVIVSGFIDYKELPCFFRIAIKLRLYLLFPPSILKHFSSALNYFFSVTDAADSKVLMDVIRKTDPVFLNWALKHISKFNLPAKQIKIVRIHGDKDRVIPVNRQNTEYIIPMGGHFMIYNRKKDVIAVLEKAIS